MFEKRWSEMVGWGFPSVQDKAELRWLYDRVAGSRSYLEIGTSFGGSLYVVASGLAPKSTIVSVDLPKFRLNPSKWSRDLPHLRQVDLVADGLRAMGHTVHIIRADSHDPNTVKTVMGITNTYDSLFIDGDHSLAGVMMDHMNYGPMARKIFFHDINTPNVKDYWASLGGEKDELITQYGMGMLK